MYHHSFGKRTLKSNRTGMYIIPNCSKCIIHFNQGIVWTTVNGCTCMISHHCNNRKHCSASEYMLFKWLFSISITYFAFFMCLLPVCVCVCVFVVCFFYWCEHKIGWHYMSEWWSPSLLHHPNYASSGNELPKTKCRTKLIV